MPNPECPSDEEIVRALTTADWDEARGRYQSSAFAGAGISVSRLKILPLSELVPIFRSDLEKPPKLLRAVGQIEVGALQQIGLEHQRPLTVVEAPTEKNPAHAEIPQQISRGLSLAVLAQLQLHRV